MSLSNEAENNQVDKVRQGWNALRFTWRLALAFSVGTSGAIYPINHYLSGDRVAQARSLESTVGVNDPNGIEITNRVSPIQDSEVTSYLTRLNNEKPARETTYPDTYWESDVHNFIPLIRKSHLDAFEANNGLFSAELRSYDDQVQQILIDAGVLPFGSDPSVSQKGTNTVVLAVAADETAFNAFPKYNDPTNFLSQVSSFDSIVQFPSGTMGIDAQGRFTNVLPWILNEGLRLAPGHHGAMADTAANFDSSVDGVIYNNVRDTQPHLYAAVNGALILAGKVETGITTLSLKHTEDLETRFRTNRTHVLANIAKQSYELPSEVGVHFPQEIEIVGLDADNSDSVITNTVNAEYYLPRATTGTTGKQLASSDMIVPADPNNVQTSEVYRISAATKKPTEVVLFVRFNPGSSQEKQGRLIFQQVSYAQEAAYDSINNLSPRKLKAKIRAYSSTSTVDQAQALNAQITVETWETADPPIPDTPTVTPTLTATRTSTPSETSTEIATPTTTPTGTDTPTPTETPTATATPTDIPSSTPTETGTVTETPTVTQTETDTATATSTEIGTPTPSEIATSTSTPSNTATNIPTATTSSTSIPSGTTTSTATATGTRTPSATSAPAGSGGGGGGVIPATSTGTPAPDIQATIDASVQTSVAETQTAVASATEAARPRRFTFLFPLLGQNR